MTIYDKQCHDVQWFYTMAWTTYHVNNKWNNSMM